MNIKNLTIKSFNDKLIKKELSSEEVVSDFFSEIDLKDNDIKSFLSLYKEEAKLEAKMVDKKIRDGENISYLSGVPLAIKDNILINGQKTTAASRILENYESAYDATVIKKLRSLNAVFLGKTNLDEFAMGSSTENSAFQTTKNPHNTNCVPGGSSGGSSAAVSANFALCALGSDTGGSIRQPAAFCGVVGLKPTYGSVSRFGLISMASSLDQIGPITKTVEDAAILFDAISGRDENDSTSVEQKQTSVYEEIKKRKDFSGMTIGIPKEYFKFGLDKTVEDGVNFSISILKKMGFKFKDINLPHTEYALSCYYIIMPAEVSANLARFDGIRYSRISNVKENSLNLKEIYIKQRGEGFGGEAKRRILLGTFVLSSGYYDAYYAKAQKVRSLIKNDFEKIFNDKNSGVDVVLTPVAPTLAFKIGERISDPLSMYLSDVFTIPASMSGLPAISIPIKKYEIGKNELPVGFQLIGKPFHEVDILGIGVQYERDLI